jgi:hypothetical protein
MGYGQEVTSQGRWIRELPHPTFLRANLDTRMPRAPLPMPGSRRRACQHRRYPVVGVTEAQQL